MRRIDVYAIFGAAASVLLVSTVASGKDTAPVETDSVAFASCVTARVPEVIERGLSENWAPEKYMTDMPRGARDKCGKGRLTLHSPDLRYSLAIVSLDMGHLLTQPIDFSSVPPLSHTMKYGSMLIRRESGQTSEDLQAEMKAAADNDAILSGVGECTVRTDPEKARLFLLDPNSKSMRATITPVLSSCVPSNTQIKFDASTMTGLIALSYIRLIYAASEDAGDPNA